MSIFSQILAKRLWKLLESNREVWNTLKIESRSPDSHALMTHNYYLDAWSSDIDAREASLRNKGPQGSTSDNMKVRR